MLSFHANAGNNKPSHVKTPFSRQDLFTENCLGTIKNANISYKSYIKARFNQQNKMFFFIKLNSIARFDHFPHYIT